MKIDSGAPAGGGRPAFSVLVAAYNQAEYVCDTLDTVAAQSCADWELVVVNDGSTDDSEARLVAWIERFRRAHPNRVIFHSIENSGQSAALEYAFELSSGRWIALLDSDDRWLPGKLEAVLRLVEDDAEVGTVVHPMLVIDGEGNRTGDVRPMRAKLAEGDLREQIRRTSRHVAPATSAVVIRADVFRELVPMPTKRFRTAADAYLTLGSYLLAPVRALPEPLAEYRMHANGNHIRTMLSPDGLRKWVELQEVLAGHFGLERVASRNSYFLRHVFALAKLEGGVGAQARAYLRLARATWGDESFGAREKVMFTGYWTACLVAPPPLFRKLWRIFQLKQTGFDKIGLKATARSGM
jgi:glycosyltransferase involved in cell wall biosynthesis